VRWITTLQFSYNKNEITKYLLPATTGSTYLNSGTAVYPAIGYPVFAIWSYRSPGLDNTGNPVGYLDGKESKDYINIISKTTLDQLVYHGPGAPVVFGNLMNEFSYKRVTVSFNLLYRFGHYFRRAGLNYNFLFNNWNGHSDLGQRWQQPGDEFRTHVPVMTYPVNTSRESFYTNSEVLVEKADNIRLKDVRVNYDINLSKRRIGLRHVQLFVYANNVAMLWKVTKTNIDPDILFEIPQPLTVTFGLKANF
jgi:TonB-dependent starch-binding outer membrane protein SusC